MNVINSYAKGIQDALLRPKGALVLWLVNAAFAALVYFVTAGAVISALGRSLAADDLLSRSNVDALFELLTGSGAALSALLTIVLVLLVLYLFVSPLLYGGILYDLVRPRDAGGFASSFWAGAGRFYGRFFRLIPASLILWVPAAAFFILAGRPSQGARPLTSFGPGASSLSRDYHANRPRLFAPALPKRLKVVRQPHRQR